LASDWGSPSSTADRWGRAIQSLRKRLGDILIASVAISRQLPLVTRNRRDFEALAKAARVELDLVDWTRSQAKNR
jgi:predicted nucleic acid-binding protein